MADDDRGTGLLSDLQDAWRRARFGLVAPPLAWAGGLGLSYTLVPWACGAASGLALLHLVSLGALAAAALGAISAVRAWRASGGRWPQEAADTRERVRFLSAIATFSGSLFSLVLFMQWIAVLLLGPCDTAIRGPFTPDL